MLALSLCSGGSYYYKRHYIHQRIMLTQRQGRCSHSTAVSSMENQRYDLPGKAPTLKKKL